MTADSLLLVLVGLVAGFGVGYVTAWRFSRKLEHHGVALWKWDQHWDVSSTPSDPADVTPFERRSTR